MNDRSAENCQEVTSGIIKTMQLTEFEFVVLFFGEFTIFLLAIEVK